MDEELLREMVRKDYVIFGPKTERDLRKDYPELWDYPEIAKLTPSEILFVWWYACASSPIISLSEEKRFPIAVDNSFKGIQKEERRQRYAPTGQAPSLPGEIKEACRVMGKFNPWMRIQMAVDNLYLLEECRKCIHQGVPLVALEEKDPLKGAQLSAELREDYMKTAALARKMMGEIMKDIERGNHGVEEVQNTTLANLEGLSAAFHKNQE